MKTPRLLARSLFGITLLTAGSVAAQEDGARDGEFSVQRFAPAPGPNNYLSVAGARMSGPMTGSASLWFDYQREPFTVRRCVSPTDCSSPQAENQQDISVIENMMTWNAMGSFIPVEWAQVGLRVPVMLVTGEGFDESTGGPAAEGLDAVGLGDIFLEGKFRFFGEPGDLVLLGAAADISVPTGHATAEGGFLGDSSPLTGGLRLIADFNYEDFYAAVNARGVFKDSATLGNTTLGLEFRYSAALAYRVHPLFTVLAEGFGSTGFSTDNGENAFEVDGGLRITPLDGMVGITLAGGTGVVQGVGVPVARGILGLGFYYERSHDDDGDGIANDVDQCPSKAEDLDGIQDDDGCPELDADGDNIPDDVDRCPEKPESDNGYKDDDGCPDAPGDADGDGIIDEEDKCPELAGDMTRPDALGCPDADGDFVPDDGRDQCLDGPLAVEDADGFDDLDGCADPDNDGDGVPDELDECGDFAETKNGHQDQDGCPDIGPDDDEDGFGNDEDDCKRIPERWNDETDDDGCAELSPSLVTVKKDGIRFVNDLEWTGNEIAEGNSKKAVSALANALKQWVSIMQLEIRVTAGDEAQATARAEALERLLVEKGVGKKRLVARGAAGGEGTELTILRGPRP